MKKCFYLKGLLVVLFVLFGMGSFAQEIKKLKFGVETASRVELKNGSLPSGVTVFYKSTYGSKYQLTGGNSMTLTLKSFPFSVSSVTLHLRTNTSSGQGNLTVKHNDVQIHRTDKLTTNPVSYGTTYKDYTFNAEDEATIGDLLITLAATANSIYCDAFTITYVDYSPQGQGTEDPHNSFENATEYATVGESYTVQEITTPSTGRKSYASSAEAVATIDNNGYVELKKAGETTITVKTAADDTYKEGSASYKLIVAKGTPVLSFAQETVTAYLGTDQAGPELTNMSDGAVTYTISPDIASIQSNGFIQPKSEGTATVTAATGETNAWLPASASYTLTVKKAFSVDAKGSYELVTDAKTLKHGDQILISYVTSSSSTTSGYVGYVLGEQGTNKDNFKATGLKSGAVSDKSTFEVTSEKNVTAAILESSSTGWYFHTNSGYLYAASSNYNYLRASSTAGVNNIASVSINDGNAIIKFLGEYNRNLLRYNSQSVLFSCYSSGQQPVQIYRKVNDVTLAISSVGYATMYYSDRSLKVPTGVTAKTYKVESGKLTESKTYSAGEVIPKDEAVVLKGAKGEYTFTATTAEAEKDADNQLRGTDESERTTGGNYYYALQASSKDGKHGPGMYWMNSTGAAFENGAHKAYMALQEKFAEAQGLAKEFYLFDDATTGISGIDTTETNDHTEMYNLNGQRVGRGYRGVVIKNGKKSLVK